MFLQLIDGVPREVRLSGKPVPSSEDLAAQGIFSFTRPPPPQINTLTETIAEGEFAQDAAGAWSRDWVVVSRSDSAEMVAGQKRLARQFVNRFFDDRAASIAGEFPATEVASWPEKVAAARAHLGGAATAFHTALLTAEAEGVGRSVGDLATSIAGKAEAYAILSAQMSAVRQKAFDAIAAADLYQDAQALAPILAHYSNAENWP